MGRSIWKNNIFKKIKIKKYKSLKIWKRNSVITFYYLNKLVYIATGKFFRKIFITRDHIGYKFGEFALTRLSATSSKFLKKNTKKKKDNKWVKNQI